MYGKELTIEQNEQGQLHYNILEKRTNITEILSSKNETEKEQFDQRIKSIITHTI